jgi:hypothetical protein
MNTNTSTIIKEMRARLSTLWIFVMLNMIFADIFSFMHPGVLEQILSGDAGEIQMTPEFLLAAAIMTEIPIAMVLLSRVLAHKPNRIANLVAAVVTIVFVIGGGSMTLTYVFFAALEIAAMLCVLWFAWRWRNPETVSHGATLQPRELGGQA